MSIVSIKHGSTEFITLDGDRSITLYTANKIIPDDLVVDVVDVTNYTGSVHSIVAGDKPINLYVVFDYDGTEKTNGYTCPVNVNMLGQDRATETGTYTAEYTPKTNYYWSDMTTNTVNVVLLIRYDWDTRPLTSEEAALEPILWREV